MSWPREETVAAMPIAAVARLSQSASATTVETHAAYMRIALMKINILLLPLMRTDRSAKKIYARSAEHRTRKAIELT
jgi:hypothetical protein